MPKIIKNEDGTESEVFTTEEFEAKIKEIQDKSIETAKEAASQMIEEFKASIPPAKSDDTKDQQVARLRSDRDELKQNVMSEIESLKTAFESFKSTATGDIKTELINSLAGGDKELRDKIEFHYDSFKGDAVSKEEIQSRVASAYKLADSSGNAPAILDNILSGAGQRGSSVVTDDTKTEKMTDNAKGISKALGITDEQLKKYGPGGEKSVGKTN